MSDIVLVSCYELGHQPLAVASAAGFLGRAGFVPACIDLAVDHLDEAALELCARARICAISVPAPLVVEDALRQVAAGARHIPFGDPDFLNAPKHALAVARGLHAAAPAVSFDFTAKVTHLLAHAELLPELAGLGCVFVISA